MASIYIDSDEEWESSSVSTESSSGESSVSTRQTGSSSEPPRSAERAREEPVSVRELEGSRTPADAHFKNVFKSVMLHIPFNGCFAVGSTALYLWCIENQVDTLQPLRSYSFAQVKTKGEVYTRVFYLQMKQSHYIQFLMALHKFGRIASTTRYRDVVPVADFAKYVGVSHASITLVIDPLDHPEGEPTHVMLSTICQLAGMQRLKMQWEVTLLPTFMKETDMIPITLLDSCLARYDVTGTVTVTFTYSHLSRVNWNKINKDPYFALYLNTIVADRVANYADSEGLTSNGDASALVSKARNNRSELFTGNRLLKTEVLKRLLEGKDEVIVPRLRSRSLSLNRAKYVFARVLRSVTKDSTCMLCCEDLGSEPVYLTSCKHVFHHKCVVSMLVPYYRELLLAKMDNRETVPVFLDAEGNVCSYTHLENCPLCRTPCFKMLPQKFAVGDWKKTPFCV